MMVYWPNFIAEISNSLHPTWNCKVLPIWILANILIIMMAKRCEFPDSSTLLLLDGRSVINDMHVGTA